MAERSIRVAMVEDDKEIARFMRGILDTSEGINVVRVFVNGDDFLAAFTTLEVDVVLMDLNLPGRDGITCIREAKTAKPGVQFMVLTVFENPAYVFQALCAGATGYLVKSKAPQELVPAVRDIHAGGSPMSSFIARLVVGSFQSEAKQRIVDDRLTDREKEILDLLAAGLMYKEIAAKWDLSTETVRKHVRNIYAKLHVGGRMEAIRKVYPGR
jgi:DNA-binding NarL/FixJ family response regulator